ncbi:MAG: HypC/HybG/HupF family hydrogenase formation chaperone [Alphaproteobacteria bacterium]|nr:HypC/HybG/HupF family hydrogenase formation chaperone [Alphaproteobacteria bacterium]
MCLGIPGQIVEISDPARKLAIADVSGVKREVNVACILGDGQLDDLIGTWTLIHVGFAMSRIDEAEAAETLKVLQMLGEAQEEIEAMRASAAE